MVKIASWNVNSIKSRIEHLIEYLRSDDAPDILLLQELKCQTEAFPYMEIEDAGYNVAVHGQKTYNGVAILSKFPIDDVIRELPGEETDDHARYIEAVISLKDKAIRVASIYVPNGQTPDSDKFQYKLRFFDRLYNHAEQLLKLDEAIILGGDYNVAPAPIDVFDALRLDGTTCYHPAERKKFRALTSLGLTDAYRACNDNKQQFSWWDYRAGAWQHNHGMRIDHLLLSPEAADMLESSDVFMPLRAKEKASDHTPVWCMLK
ncbi:MAG: exodeoxyribonuclease Xth [Rickettsiaceae bacterium]|jgi:exodeoxyribonuclease-3|nr:exodeoxyribonuclease Xth [Rickettsiaceae bacterium]